MIDITPELVKICRRKINAYKTFDKRIRLHHPVENENLETINIDDAVTLLVLLENNLCEGCGCEMLFTGYTPYCQYQFSFDRIDNNKIHSAENIRIICLSCNVQGYFYGKYKVACDRKCHDKHPIYKNEYFNKVSHSLYKYRLRKGRYWGHK